MARIDLAEQWGRRKGGRKNTNDALITLLRADTLTMVLLCAAAFVCGTAAGATWVVDDGGGGADRMRLQTAEAAG